MIIQKELVIPTAKNEGVLFFPIFKDGEYAILEVNAKNQTCKEIDLIDFLGEVCGISADEYSTLEEDDEDENVPGDYPLSWEERKEIIVTLKSLNAL